MKRQTILIDGIRYYDDKPIEIVKSSMIYNDPYVISAQYDAKVRHDMASGK